MLNVITISYFTIACSSQWIIVSDPPLFRSLSHAACAVYNDAIFLMGDRQLQEHQICSNTIIDHGSSALPIALWNLGFYWSQWNDKLYAQTAPTRGTFDFQYTTVYNLSYTNFPNDASLIDLDPSITFGDGFCVAASEEFVFITGGQSTASALNVLTLSNSTWSLGPSLQTTRLDHNCIVVSNHLYLIGNVAEVEKIFITNTHTQSWKYISSLTERVLLPGVAVFDAIIWVLGGRDPVTNEPMDKVWNIDTSDGSVVLLQERLPNAVELPTFCIAKGTAYVFSEMTQWMRYDIRNGVRCEPTNAPTITASTFSPTTTAPSSTPSTPPIASPSNEPSPSFSPSKHLIPTINAVLVPTFSPISIQSTVVQTHSFTEDIINSIENTHSSPTKPSSNEPTITATQMDTEHLITAILSSVVVILCICALFASICFYRYHQTVVHKEKMNLEHQVEQNKVESEERSIEKEETNNGANLEMDEDKLSQMHSAHVHMEGFQHTVRVNNNNGDKLDTDDVGATEEGEQVADNRNANISFTRGKKTKGKSTNKVIESFDTALCDV